MLDSEPGQDTAKDQEPLEPPITPAERARAVKYGTSMYKPAYAQACFHLLSSSHTAKTKAHCCALLQCSKPTLLSWMKKYPAFGDAITSGLKIGEAKWRNKIARHAFKPTSDVNNGLIKLLSANVYGISDDSEAPNINITQTVNNQDPEELMKARGIPIPDVEIEDVE